MKSNKKRGNKKATKPQISTFEIISYIIDIITFIILIASIFGWIKIPN